MIRALVLAVIVAVAVGLGLTLLGGILADLGVPIAETIGSFLESYAFVIGVLAGLWYFFTHSDFTIGRP